LWPDFYQNWVPTFCGATPPHFWSLFQAYERKQLRGTIDAWFVALIDRWLVCITEQELVVYVANSKIRKMSLAVEPRQLALNVRLALCRENNFSLTRCCSCIAWRTCDVLI
jgi:hypothetical protein